MTKIKKISLVSMFLIGALSMSVTNAAITVAGVEFDADNAFADVLLGSSGSWSTSGGSLESVLTDNSANSWAFSSGSDGYVNLGFTDNVVVNGAGFDLAIFEIGVADAFDLSLTLGGVSNFYSTAYTGFTTGAYGINVAFIDLSDFGIAAGASINEVSLYGNAVSGNTGCCQPTFGLVGALNSAPNAVPEASSILLLGLGLAGLGFTRRKKQS